MKISIRTKLTVLITSIVGLVLAAIYLFLKTRLTQDHAAVYDSSQMLARLDHAIAIAFVFSLAAVVAMSYLISYLVTRRVRTVARAARSMARGHYHKLYLKTGDEIEDLTEAINDLSSQIDSRIQEINTNKSRLEATFLSMFDGVMILDQEGNILLINKTLRELLEIHDDVAGSKPIEIIRNQDIQELADAVLSTEKSAETREIVIYQPYERTVMVHATAIKRDDRLDGAILVFHDITELRKLEQIRRDFVANVSHELRTPMTNIKGYSETLLDGALEDSKVARDFVQIIKNDADRLTQLIDDLLQLAKIESGTEKFDKRLHDLKAIIENVIRDLVPQARKRNVTIQNLIASPIYAFVDNRAMTQVFVNLLDNAIKYNHDGGSVAVSADAQDDRVTVSVTDTGMGIPAEDLPRVFERFYRVDKAHSRKIGGTGLGLSIVKHIIQIHGGEINVQSEVNHGTTFQVTLYKDH